MKRDLNRAQHKMIKQITGWGFLLYLMANLPMGLLAGLRVRSLSTEKCVTSVPFKWLNKNPFKSTYFAVQSMAAELSTASTCLLAVTGQKPSIAFIIVDCIATFSKKATSRVYFTCENGSEAFAAVEKCISNGEPEIAKFKTVGKMKDGSIVSEFEFTWSFKQRRS
jgi:hypothetical protein